MRRREFLQSSGLLTAGIGSGFFSTQAYSSPIKSGPIKPATSFLEEGVVEKKTVCTHCSVGCSVIAQVKNGIWVGQEPAFESPINMGSHCAKGASVRELTHGERRLKYPMKLENGQWKRISWETAIEEVGNKLLEIRNTQGPDSVYWLGSAKFTNESAFLFRKFAAMWGTNTIDHQARICHSTTVAGVSNTFGFGAMTNSFNDIYFSKAIMIMGGNPAEAHPVSLQHILEAKERNHARLIVIDPRFTRTAAHSTDFIRIRPGTDIPVIWGIIWHIFKNGWEDRKYLQERTFGIEELRKEVAKWSPEEVERVTGVPGHQLENVARIMSQNRPSTLIWCMGATQKTVGTANVRAYSILQLVLGNIGVSGGGANVFRGHDNVQGATDMGLDVTTLPAYMGLSEGAWRHFCRVWGVDYEWMVSRFASKQMMETKGIPSTRWFDAVLVDKSQIDQPNPVKAMVAWGHAANSINRMPIMRKAMDKIDLMLVVDPNPGSFAIEGNRKEGTYLLPAATAFEGYGSVTASNRSLQWREQVVPPIFEAKDDLEIMYLFAKKFGFAEELCKNIQVTNNMPLPEDILREINMSCWSIGYTGQSPERLKSHMKHQADFDPVTLRATKGPNKGDYYGLPWPCWGNAEVQHPGTPYLYNPDIPVMEGGCGFRARWGVERHGQTLLAENSPVGSEIKGGYPEFTYAVLKKLGWDKDLTPQELAIITAIGGQKIDTVSWQTDMSGGIQRVALKHGCAPFGNGKARILAWNLPDPIPVHREPIFTPRRDLIDQYPAISDRRDFRLPYLSRSIQEVDHAKNYPMILTTGRIVEYEGGGDETRSNAWLAEIVQEAYAEISREDAKELGIKEGTMIWIHGAAGDIKVHVRAHVSNRTAKGVVFMPFHFGGITQGVSQRERYPHGADPYVLGEAADQLTTYGFDPVTHMQETKVTLCRVEAA
ncbi:formate dehydrogenase subunit alpha [Entomobacter blattae]|uniref:formate dehydrogenase subunit alpha n=1 Tax=Entomobacter blattae TaxID=2762277 RepID=UPI00193BDF40|nr:formate dehydrogenase subunit alpha [Entomobacter blattae]